jgi:D-proline reductase (dithiol) PrdB
MKTVKLRLREVTMQPPVEYMTRIRENYAKLGYKPYQWVVNEEPPPWQPLRKPLSECRLGLIASGGIYVTGQVAFHFKDDASFRVIPRTVKTTDLRTAHFAYDQTDARRDPNVVFPIDTLRRLVRERFIGELADYAYTFMGGIYSSRRVRDDLAPQLTERLLAEKVDVALLVPV